MWFKLERNLLEDLINRVVGIIPSRTPYPIIQNVLCSTDTDMLSFLATDLDIYVKTWIGLKAKEEAKILLPGINLPVFPRTIPKRQSAQFNQRLPKAKRPQLIRNTL